MIINDKNTSLATELIKEQKKQLKKYKILTIGLGIIILVLLFIIFIKI